MGRDNWRTRVRPGPLMVAFAVPAVVLFGIGIFILPELLNDLRAAGVPQALALAGAVLVTVGVPVWLVTMHVSVRITEHHLRVRLWPLFGKTVPLQAITSVTPWPSNPSASTAVSA